MISSSTTSSTNDSSSLTANSWHVHWRRLTSELTRPRPSIPASSAVNNHTNNHNSATTSIASSSTAAATTSTNESTNSLIDSAPFHTIKHVDNSIPSISDYNELFGCRPLTDSIVLLQCLRCRRTLLRSAFPAHQQSCTTTMLLAERQAAMNTNRNTTSPHTTGGIAAGSSSPFPTAVDTSNAPFTPSSRKRQRGTNDGMDDSQIAAGGGSGSSGASGDGGSGANQKRKKVKMAVTNAAAALTAAMDDITPPDSPSAAGPMLDEICGVSLTSPPPFETASSGIPPPPLASEAGRAPKGVCLQPLNCSIHSVGQKKAVAGRSMSYQYLLGRQTSEIAKVNAANAKLQKGEKKSSSATKRASHTLSDSDDETSDDSVAEEVDPKSTRTDSSCDDDDPSTPLAIPTANRTRGRSGINTTTSRESSSQSVRTGHLTDPLLYPPNSRTRDWLAAIDRSRGSRALNFQQRHVLATRCWNLAAIIAPLQSHSNASLQSTHPIGSLQPSLLSSSASSAFVLPPSQPTPWGANPYVTLTAERAAAEKVRAEAAAASNKGKQQHAATAGSMNAPTGSQIGYDRNVRAHPNPNPANSVAAGMTAGHGGYVNHTVGNTMKSSNSLSWSTGGSGGADAQSSSLSSSALPSPPMDTINPTISVRKITKPRIPKSDAVKREEKLKRDMARVAAAAAANNNKNIRDNPEAQAALQSVQSIHSQSQSQTAAMMSGMGVVGASAGAGSSSVGVGSMQTRADSNYSSNNTNIHLNPHAVSTSSSAINNSMNLNNLASPSAAASASSLHHSSSLSSISGPGSNLPSLSGIGTGIQSHMNPVGSTGLAPNTSSSNPSTTSAASAAAAASIAGSLGLNLNHMNVPGLNLTSLMTPAGMAAAAAAAAALNNTNKNIKNKPANKRNSGVGAGGVASGLKMGPGVPGLGIDPNAFPWLPTGWDDMNKLHQAMIALGAAASATGTDVSAANNALASFAANPTYFQSSPVATGGGSSLLSSPGGSSVPNSPFPNLTYPILGVPTPPQSHSQINNQQRINNQTNNININTNNINMNNPNLMSSVPNSNHRTINMSSSNTANLNPITDMNFNAQTANRNYMVNVGNSNSGVVGMSNQINSSTSFAPRSNQNSNPSTTGSNVYSTPASNSVANVNNNNANNSQTYRQQVGNYSTPPSNSTSISTSVGMYNNNNSSTIGMNNPSLTTPYRNTNPSNTSTMNNSSSISMQSTSAMNSNRPTSSSNPNSLYPAQSSSSNPVNNSAAYYRSPINQSTAAAGMTNTNIGGNNNNNNNVGGNNMIGVSTGNYLSSPPSSTQRSIGTASIANSSSGGMASGQINYGSYPSPGVGSSSSTRSTVSVPYPTGRTATTTELAIMQQQLQQLQQQSRIQAQQAAAREAATTAASNNPRQ